MNPGLLTKLLEELKTFPLREQYESEEPHLLGHVVERIRAVLPPDYQINAESWDEQKEWCQSKKNPLLDKL